MSELVLVITFFFTQLPKSIILKLIWLIVLYHWRKVNSDMYIRIWSTDMRSGISNDHSEQWNLHYAIFQNFDELD